MNIVKLHFHFNPSTNSIEMWLVKYEGGKRTCLVSGKEYEALLSIPPSFTINEPNLPAFMESVKNSLSQNGVQQSFEVEVKRLENHLEDMRNLAFNYQVLKR